MSTPPTPLARWDEEGLLGLRGELRVPVRAELGQVALGEARIQREQPLLERIAVAERATLQAPHPAQRAVQLDDALVARCVVEPVHVLGDEPVHGAAPLERRERAVRSIRLEPGEARPAQHAARPVPATDLRALHELLVLDGPTYPVPLLRAAVVGDAGLGAAAGTREHGEAVATQELNQRFEVGTHRVVSNRSRRLSHHPAAYCGRLCAGVPTGHPIRRVARKFSARAPDPAATRRVCG